MLVNKSKTEAYIKRIKPLPCPLCGKTTWSVSDRIFQISEYETDESLASKLENNAESRCMPVIALVCENCGHTHLINAMAANILDRDDEERVVNENGE